MDLKGVDNMAGEVDIHSVLIWGDPEQLDTQRVLEKVRDSHIAHFFEPDEDAVRPIMQTTEFGQFVGETEIIRAVGNLVLPSLVRSAA